MVVGPQPTITCPIGAVDVRPGTSLQAAVDGASGGATFCLRAGVHQVTSPITPKSGNTFVGEYGAVLDGSGWSVTDPAQYHYAAFMAHNQDIDDVTIRNLVIRNMPRYAVKAWYWQSDRWTLDHNDIVENVFGVSVPNDSVVRANRILRNVGVQGPIQALNGGGYSFFRATNILVEDNEIAYNASESKAMHTFKITFRRNHVHHNQHSGIWFDGDSPGGVVEDNVIEDNRYMGVFLEVAQGIIVRRNIIRRNRWNGIAVHTSRDNEIYENQIEDSSSIGVSLRMECSRYGGGELTKKWDLTNNIIRDNIIVVPSGGRVATGLLVDQNVSACGQPTEFTTVTPTAQAYLSNTKNNKWHRNHYNVPSVTGTYWEWAILPTPRAPLTRAEWQALVQDVDGRVSQ